MTERVPITLAQKLASYVRKGGSAPWTRPGPMLDEGEAQAIIDYLRPLLVGEFLETAMGRTFQARVEPWMFACFGPVIPYDKLERSDRFIEESLELVQAAEYPRERAHALVDYVYDRPVGVIGQEVGGVMVTLAALCIAHKVSLHVEAERELHRINQPEVMEKIRAKQAAKPTGSALPQ